MVQLFFEQNLNLKEGYFFNKTLYLQDKVPCNFFNNTLYLKDKVPPNFLTKL